LASGEGYGSNMLADVAEEVIGIENRWRFCKTRNGEL
jgi:protein-L-isoaspartate O-methyltransferase